MSSEPTVEEILAAIRSSGYLMEQEVASLLEAKGFHVTTNRAYKDPDEEKSREIDVSARKCGYEGEENQFGVYAEIVAECKNNSAPFVFIGRRKNATDMHPQPEEYLFPVNEYSFIIKEEKGTKTSRPVPAFMHLGLDKVHYCYSLPDKMVQFCRMVRQGKGWEANHGGVYDSILIPLIKAFLARREEVKTFQHNQRLTWLFFPLVVLSGKIYYVDSNSSSPVPEEVEHVSFIRELRSKTASGNFMVDFVTQAGLQEFLDKKLLSFLEHVSSVLKNERPKVIQYEVR
jgi:hypothetical protein